MKSRVAQLEDAIVNDPNGKKKKFVKRMMQMEELQDATDTIKFNASRSKAPVVHSQSMRESKLKENPLEFEELRDSLQLQMVEEAKRDVYKKTADAWREKASMAPKKMRNFVDKKGDFKYVVLALCLLNVNAGYINGVTLHGALALPVSHVTGTATNVGIYLAIGKWDKLWDAIGLILCFGAGATLSGLIVPFESFNMNRSYGKLLVIMGSCLVAAQLLEVYLSNQPWFLFFCCFACGMQNAMTTRYSGKVVRTTHLTGCLTDIGIIAAHCLRGKVDELWQLKILSLQFFFYVLGGFIATHLNFITNCELLLPIVIYAVLGIKHAMILSERKGVPFWGALTGNNNPDGSRRSWVSKVR